MLRRTKDQVKAEGILRKLAAQSPAAPFRQRVGYSSSFSNALRTISSALSLSSEREVSI